MDTLKQLERTVFTIDYLAGHNQGDERTLGFVAENILEQIRCSYLALWQLSQDGAWIKLGETGDSIALAPIVPNWHAYNQNIVRRYHPVCRTVSGAVLTSMRFFGSDVVIHAVHQPEDEQLVENLLALAGRIFLLFKGRSALTDAVKNLGLSDRQRQILEFMADGMSYSHIARQLGFSESLIKQEAMRICDRLNVRSRFEAAAWLRKQRTGQ